MVQDHEFQLRTLKRQFRHNVAIIYPKEIALIHSSEKEFEKFVKITSKWLEAVEEIGDKRFPEEDFSVLMDLFLYLTANSDIRKEVQSKTYYTEILQKKVDDLSELNDQLKLLVEYAEKKDVDEPLPADMNSALLMGKNEKLSEFINRTTNSIVGRPLYCSLLEVHRVIRMMKKYYQYDHQGVKRSESWILIAHTKVISRSLRHVGIKTNTDIAKWIYEYTTSCNYVSWTKTSRDGKLKSADEKKKDAIRTIARHWISNK
jgi:hypothetical protein